MEGLGGPVDIDQYSRDVADPALEDCCRREVCAKDAQDNGIRLQLLVIKFR